MSDIEDKCFSLSDHNKFLSDILNAKVKEKELVHKSYISGFVDNFDLDKKIGTLAAKAELKAEHDKTEKLQTYDSSLFIVQSFVDNNGLQNFLIFRPIYKIFKILTGLTDTIVEKESKGLSNEKNRPSIATNHSLSLKLIWINISKIGVRFKGSNFYSKKCSKPIYCL